MTAPARYGGWARAAFSPVVYGESGGLGGLGVAKGARPGGEAAVAEGDYDHRFLFGVALSSRLPYLVGGSSDAAGTGGRDAAGDAAERGGPGAAKGRGGDTAVAEVYHHRYLLGVTMYYYPDLFHYAPRVVHFWKRYRGTDLGNTIPRNAAALSESLSKSTCSSFAISSFPSAINFWKLCKETGLVDTFLGNTGALIGSLAAATSSPSVFVSVPMETKDGTLNASLSSNCGEYFPVKSGANDTVCDDMILHGGISLFSRRYSQGAGSKPCADEGWKFLKERYYDPARRMIDSTLRGMGFAPQGPVSRVVILLFAYGALSQALKEAADGANWIGGRVRCYSAGSTELRQCIGRYVCKFCTALLADASGWDHIEIDSE